MRYRLLILPLFLIGCGEAPEDDVTVVSCEEIVLEDIESGEITIVPCGPNTEVEDNEVSDVIDFDPATRDAY